MLSTYHGPGIVLSTQNALKKKKQSKLKGKKKEEKRKKMEGRRKKELKPKLFIVEFKTRF